MALNEMFVGEIVTELLKQLNAISHKSCFCKSSADNLITSIQELLPIIEELKYSGVELPAFRQSQLNRFSETLRGGIELAGKVLESGRWNVYKNLQLVRKMEKLEKQVERFISGPMQAHLLADVHHMRFETMERFNRLEQRLDSMKTGSGRWVEEAVKRMEVEGDSNLGGFSGIGLELGKGKVKKMMIERDDLNVVGIWGIGGSGKTTLANEICRDNQVQSYFNNRILFLTVSQSPDLEQLRAKIWGFITGNEPLNYTRKSQCEWGSGPQALVVLDDVWSLPVLEQLIFRVPTYKTLVISRFKFPRRVVNEVYEVELLEEDESMSLFCHSAFGQKSIPPTANETLVKQIVDECKGLPLALKVIGASLQDQPEMYWINARKRLSRGELICESHENKLLDRMAISVECLKKKVKECFMDLGSFPEDKKIPLDVLVNMWVEIHNIDEEEAFTILMELSDKNLLTLVKDARAGEAYCSYHEICVTQHDVLRDLALHLSNKGEVNERKRLLMPRRDTELPRDWEKNADQPFNAQIVSVQTGEMREMDWFHMEFPKTEVLILNFCLSSDMCSSNSDLVFYSKCHIKSVKKKGSRRLPSLKCSSMSGCQIGSYRCKRLGGGLHGNTAIDRLTLLRCKCQQAESASGVDTGEGNGAWFVDNAKKLNLNGSMNSEDILEFKTVEQLKRENEVSMSNGKVGTGTNTIFTGGVDSVEDEAWKLLRASMVYYCGSPVGTIAANDPTSSNVLNYDQVFIRDFIPSGIAFLLKGEYDIVRNFILHTLQLQSWEKTMDCHSPGQGLMPASFKVRTVPLDGDDSATEEVLDPDFGEAAIGRVAPVDSGLWWIILLRAYGKCSDDLSVQERVDVQTGIKMILRLCLADGFDMFPTLLVTDGSCMIDRRMGIHGHPLEIQALFYSALLCAREMLIPGDGSADLIRALNNRLVALSFHIREYYWIDMRKLNEIYRYKTEEYSYDAVNKFNIYPDQISPWLVEWMPNKGGYLIGNLQPAHMDFRFFSLGNLWAVVSGLATIDQSHAILDLIETKWADLVAEMPFKICYPALEGQGWQIITGCDPKNTPWSYHNAGSWPTLLWQLTVACMKMNRPEIAAKAVSVAEKRISKDKWPEYYDTKKARFIGKQSRLFQTWSIAGFLVAKLLLADRNAAKILTTEEDSELVNAFSCMISANPRRKRGPKRCKQTYIV